MTDTARDYLIDDPAATDGLEDLFADTVAEDADTLTTTADNDTDTVVSIETDADIIEWITTTQAAARLGKSERTIQRYAKAGKLQSHSDESGKLLIGLSHCADTLATDADESPSSADTESARADNLPTESTNADMSPSSADILYGKVIEDYRKQINDLQSKLEGATFQLGRMQAEIEHKDIEIKLLTDSQHKSGAWRRFCSWFFGQ